MSVVSVFFRTFRSPGRSGSSAIVSKRDVSRSVLRTLAMGDAANGSAECASTVQCVSSILVIVSPPWVRSHPACGTRNTRATQQRVLEVAAISAKLIDIQENPLSSDRCVVETVAGKQS